jgi:redox-sensitive bicupin YhaK (pirin superfamily)
MNRKIQQIRRDQGKHWVGDGFPVSTLFFYGRDHNISPFLLFDYAGPAEFVPSDGLPRGVDQHPHRGFETVTIIYEGEVEHRDTAGNSGKIGPGDVQWMTAGRGILHEEKHSTAFTQKGGRLEMVQLWVNLPAKDKMTAPRYQEILSNTIPVVDMEGNAVRIIAGEFAGTKGAAQTFTPLHLYDIGLQTNASLTIPVKDGFNALLMVLEGGVSIEGETVSTGELAMFVQQGNQITINATHNTKLLFMAGEPINEPVIGAGPFVMNTEAEIKQAFSDFRGGKF